MKEEHPLILDEENFSPQILETDEIAMVDFWAPWCPPCRTLSPIIEHLAGEYAGRARVGKVNIDENPSLATYYNIRSVPTLLFFQAGAVMDNVVGAVPIEFLRAKLEAQLAAH